MNIARMPEVSNSLIVFINKGVLPEIFELDQGNIVILCHNSNVEYRKLSLRKISSRGKVKRYVSYFGKHFLE
jgi:hypothetical protein